MPHRSEHLITNPADLDAVCKHLADQETFGFDTEFVGEHSFHPELCLVQVATKDQLLILDPLTLGDLRPFWELTTDPRRRVVVHAGREEIRLCHRAAGRPPGQLFDVQIAAGLMGLPYPVSHAGLVDQLLGVRLSKAETLTDWRKRPLSPRQIRYAFDDVRHLLNLHEIIQEELERRGRLEWCAEENARQTLLATSEEIQLERWRKLPGLGKLTSRQLAIARELYLWRHQRAEALAKPARVLCRDDLLVEIARREPASVADLQLLRGVSKKDYEPIMAAVRRALDAPPESWPAKEHREADTPQLALMVDFLQLVVRQIGEEMELSPALIGTVAEFKALIKHTLYGEPLKPDLLIAQGWRAVHLKPRLEEALRGKTSLRLAPRSPRGPLELH